jgi:S-adenosylmethionine:tRNA ribosyltransferase-isomerase
MPDEDLVDSYDYELPDELIAREPAAARDASRLLTVDRTTGEIAHRQMREFPELLRPGDLLVLNETRVIAARLSGFRTATGGRWEGLYLGTTPDGVWRIIGQTRGKLRAGETLTLVASGNTESARELVLELLESRDEGEWVARPQSDRDALALLDEFGAVPLPPYIERAQPTALDRERYQTVYARQPGAIAAPTAGLHFTPELLEACLARGAEIARVTLHVGLGTFRPISVERLGEHRMHSEWCEVPVDTAAMIRQVREQGGRIIAVGTTTVRTLESAAATGEVGEWRGETDLFIRPPYRFRVVDGLLTNFHLPRSTLLVLVSTFAGRELIFRAYQEAVARRYRFYSYGDAMFVT